jgi:hypothetical protein
MVGRLIFLMLFSSSVAAQDGEIFTQHVSECWNYAKDEWYEYDVFVRYEETLRKNGEFTHVTLTMIPQPAGVRTYITCTIRDGEEAKLSKYRFKGSPK